MQPCAVEVHLKQTKGSCMHEAPNGHSRIRARLEFIPSRTNDALAEWKLPHDNDRICLDGRHSDISSPKHWTERKKERVGTENLVHSMSAFGRVSIAPYGLHHSFSINSILLISIWTNSANLKDSTHLVFKIEFNSILEESFTVSPFLSSRFRTISWIITWKFRRAQLNWKRIKNLHNLCNKNRRKLT